MQEMLPGKKKKSNIFNLTDRETRRKISEENMANYIKIIIIKILEQSTACNYVPIK